LCVLQRFAGIWTQNGSYYVDAKKKEEGRKKKERVRRRRKEGEVRRNT
jgi:hypothetical protein